MSFDIDSKWPSESLKTDNERGQSFVIVIGFPCFFEQMMKTFVSPFVNHDMTIGGWE